MLGVLFGAPNVVDMPFNLATHVCDHKDGDVLNYNLSNLNFMLAVDNNTPLTNRSYMK